MSTKPPNTRNTRKGMKLSREKAPEAQEKGKERGQPCPPVGCGRLVRIGAPTFLSASWLLIAELHSVDSFLSLRSFAANPPVSCLA